MSDHEVRGHGQTKWLHDLNWGAFNHAPHVPQSRSCNSYVCALIIT